jgi:glutamate-1-semialdehyde 2,1-aminomutase
VDRGGTNPVPFLLKKRLAACELAEGVVHYVGAQEIRERTGVSTQAIPLTSREEEFYRERTPASLRFFTKAREHMPGGDSRSTLFYPPYPVVFERGEGCLLFDLDGNRLLDFTGNHSSLVHGYGHPEILKAVQLQLRKGTSFPGATEPQRHYAELLCRRIPSLDQVRFTNSGTEATLNAIRAARAFTGRARIAKVEGGYHGTTDDVMVSTHPSGSEAGSRSQPRATSNTRGIPQEVVDNVTVIPYNDIEGAHAVLESTGPALAAVLVEPVLGSAGMIPAEQAYLEMLRELTRRLGIVLIFDEVVSFRVAYGGAQEHFNVIPDLTCLGKLIGGGFPLGAFGGRSDIMSMFDPSRGRPAVPHPGSHNAHPLGMVAGAKTLELLTKEALAQINSRGDTMRQDMTRAFTAAGIPAQITGLGSLFAVHLTEQPVRSYRDTVSAQSALQHQIFLGLFNEGVLIDPRGVGNLSTALGEQEIRRFGATLRAVLSRLREA